MRTSSAPADPGLVDRCIESGLILLVLLAPLPFGSVPRGAVFALCAAAAILAWTTMPRLSFLSGPIPPRALAAALACGAALAIVQLAPLPRALARSLSPATVERLDAIPLDAEGAWVRLSLHPGATEADLAKLAAFATIFLLAATLAARAGGDRRILKAVFVSGLFQAAYGSAEYLSGHQHIFGYVKRFYTDAATGTYINQNHFAGALELSLLIGLGLFLARLRPASHTRPSSSWRQRLTALFEEDRAAAGALATAVAILALGLVLSYSRSGLAAASLAAAGVVILDARRRGLRRRVLPAAILACGVLLLITMVGWSRVTSDLGRQMGGLTLHEGRVRVWRDSLAILRDFPIVGTGLGTFRDIYPAYRSERIQIVFDYAHNDYLQLLVEAGLVGAVLLGVLLVYFWRSVLAGLRRCRGPEFPVYLGAAGGVASLLLHELTDFNLHIPANAVLFCATAGALVGGLHAAGRGDADRVVSFHVASRRKKS